MMSTPTKHLDPDDNTAAYHRPPWMPDEQWQRTSAAMTEHWLTLLDHAARQPR
jgi:hypothetical protein